LRSKALFLVVVFVLVLSSLASADSIDVSTSLINLHALSIKAAPEQSGIVLLLDYAVRNQEYKENPEKSSGSMDKEGDYKTFEGGRSTVVLALGYEVGLITPWVGYASQTVQIKEEKMVPGQAVEGQENPPDPVKVEKETAQRRHGVALGVTAEYGEGPWSVLGTVAKLPEGIMLNARVKYNVFGIGTAHAGYIYNSHTGHGIVAGLGLSY